MKTGGKRGKYEGMNGIKARKNGIRNKDTKEIIPYWISKGLFLYFSM
jgi:hypothetical protein